MAELPPIKPIPKCDKHGHLGCRECFPSTYRVPREEPPGCEKHNVRACDVCYPIKIKKRNS